MSKPIDYFNSESLQSDLKGRTVRGAAFTGIGQAVVLAVQLVSVPILARLLAPDDFGLMALAAVATGFATMFVNAGLSMATVQRQDITPQQATNLFWLASALGAIVALFVAGASPLIAWVFDDSRLVAVTIAMTAALVMAGMTIQHQALLRRGMQFRTLTAIQVSAVIVANLAAIAFAWITHSYWALVVQSLVLIAVRMVGSWAMCHWRPDLPQRGAGIRSMVSFGANLTGFSFVNYFARNADNLLIGWMWGTGELGLYERPYKLLLFPIQQLNVPLSSVVVPALSRLANDAPSYRRYYLQIAQMLALLTVPGMIGLGLVSDWFIEFLLGNAFQRSADIFAWLALAGVLGPVMSTTGWLYISQGRGKDLFRYGLVACPLIVLFFAVGLPFGARGVAMAYGLGYSLVISPLAIWWVGSKGPVSRYDLLSLLKFPFLVALPVAGSIQAVRWLSVGLGSEVRLAIAFLAALLAYGLTIGLTQTGRQLIHQAFSVVRSSASPPAES